MCSKLANSSFGLSAWPKRWSVASKRCSSWFSVAIWHAEPARHRPDIGQLQKRLTVNSRLLIWGQRANNLFAFIIITKSLEFKTKQFLWIFANAAPEFLLVYMQIWNRSIFAHIRIYEKLKLSAATIYRTFLSSIIINGQYWTFIYIYGCGFCDSAQVFYVANAKKECENKLENCCWSRFPARIKVIKKSECFA